MEGTESPILLAQDRTSRCARHGPRTRGPDARVADLLGTFLADADVFGICPWQRGELRRWSLGADLIGPFTFNRTATIFWKQWDRAARSAHRVGPLRGKPAGPHHLGCGPYPISVAFPEIHCDQSVTQLRRRNAAAPVRRDARGGPRSSAWASIALTTPKESSKRLARWSVSSR